MFGRKLLQKKNEKGFMDDSMSKSRRGVCGVDDLVDAVHESHGKDEELNRLLQLVIAAEDRLSRARRGESDYD